MKKQQRKYERMVEDQRRFNESLRQELADKKK
jgi:hypothetical protein